MSLLLALLLTLPARAQDPARGDAAWARGDTAAALVAWSEALAAARAAGDAAVELELSLRVAAALRVAGKLDQAGQLLSTLPAEDPRVATARGQLELASGDARSAEKTLRGAFERARGAGQPAAALTAALALGDARRARGDDTGADKAWQAALLLGRDLDDRVAQGDALTRLALLARRGGELGTARARFEEAVLLYRATGRLDGEADAQAGLARVLADLGQLPAAAELLGAALATARDRADLVRQAGLLSTLAQLQVAAGQQDAARTTWQAARGAWQRANRVAEAAAIAVDLAVLDRDLAALAEATELARRAGAAATQARAELAAGALQEEADPSAAARHGRKALELAEDLGLAAVRWRALALLGRLELAAGRTERGIDQLQRAVDELERTRLGLDAASAAGFVGGHEAVYTALVDALLAEGRRVDAFLYAQRLQLASLPRLVAPGDEPAQEYQALVAEEAFLSEALAEAAGRDPAGPRATALKERLAALRVEFAAAVDRLRATYPRFDELVRIDPEDLEAVQADLDPGVVVLQPLLLPDGLALMVVRRDGLEVVRTETLPADLEGPLRTVVAAMRMPGMVSPAAVVTASEALGQALLAPAAAHLADAEVVVVCPTGVLRQLPFAMLRLDGRYLVEQAAVAQVTHVGSLRRRDATTPRDRLTGPGLLLVGNPDGTLPGAEAEVEAIAAALPGATVITGSAGTEPALRDHAAGKLAVHLATHGWVDPRQPDQSFLVLAPDAEGDDGRLAYGEIPGLAPWLSGARLVVLSACESAVPVDASERVLADGTPVISINGLAAQFRRAGVETLVASLWKVDDEGTKQLMEGLYGELARGSDVARSLRSAQLSMLAEPAWADPFYWAAFVTIGDWR